MFGLVELTNITPVNAKWCTVVTTNYYRYILNWACLLFSEKKGKWQTGIVRASHHKESTTRQQRMRISWTRVTSHEARGISCRQGAEHWWTIQCSTPSSIRRGHRTSTQKLQDSSRRPAWRHHNRHLLVLFRAFNHLHLNRWCSTTSGWLIPRNTVETNTDLRTHSVVILPVWTDIKLVSTQHSNSRACLIQTHSLLPIALQPCSRIRPHHLSALHRNQDCRVSSAPCRASITTSQRQLRSINHHVTRRSPHRSQRRGRRRRVWSTRAASAAVCTSATSRDSNTRSSASSTTRASATSASASTRRSAPSRRTWRDSTPASTAAACVNSCCPPRASSSITWPRTSRPSSASRAPSAVWCFPIATASNSTPKTAKPHSHFNTCNLTFSAPVRYRTLI